MSSRNLIIVALLAILFFMFYTQFAEELPREEVLEEKAVVQVFEKESLTEEQANYPATPDALTGEHMWQKAGELGWPTKWDARQHATHFILGTPKGGTTFVERCYSSGALSGDDHHHPYPKAAMRWPVKFTPDGEPMYKNQGFIGGWAWNRTGYRRWDLAKEWRIYISSGTDETAPKYKKLFSSLPPVEEDSGKWSVLDATPTYLMNPWAADNVHADHQHNPGKLRFVVTWREAMARSFSHFVMIVGKKNQHVKPGAFMARMHSEINHWNKTEGCHVLFDPATLLENADSDITVLRDVLRKCFKPKSFLGHSLPVLGLRYWLHHFKPEQFTVIKTEALKNSDPFFLVGILEKAFGYRRLKPKCSTPAELKSGTCSGELFYTSALDRCRDTGERAASYTKKAGALHLERGTSVEKAPIHALFRLYRKAMSDLIKKYDLAFVNISS
eukprot:TRINITY_DN5083_c0_g1_i1.p1 TRINITY_DN5083_c0_g1~~TRINITY_DN5083_c0_g1_i1.p1  ORF type:complete len:444 (+),score=81.39 TRINITY_DN5083_c0_g1_i1:49-1380(+)